MPKRPTRHTWLALTAIFIGAVFRLYHLFVVSFEEPYRLGGLFYEFSRQIVLHGFALPEQIPYYSAGGIPFGYPPLGFYVQALLMRLFDPPLFVTVNLLPPLISLLTLPAFYWMIRQATGAADHNLALAGLFAYALIPAAFIYEVEAAGLAEACGALALILYLGLLSRWKQSSNLRRTLLAGLALGGCVLSSPGSAYAATVFSILLFFWSSVTGLKSRRFRPIGWLLLVGIVGLIVSAPYWLTVMQNHGSDFFIRPFLGQHEAESNIHQFGKILSFQPVDPYLGFIWNWLILAGVFWAVTQRQFSILVVFVVFWWIPREGVWLASIPAAMLAGMGLVHLLLPLLVNAFQRRQSARPPLAPGVLALLLILGVLANALFTIQAYIADPEWQLNREHIVSLQSFRDDLPAEARLVIVGNTALAEWAPAILQREVLNIEYGLEWQPDELEKVQDINLALEENDGRKLIDAIADYSGDRQIYLIASTEDLARLRDALPPAVTLFLVSATPPLELSLLEIGE